MPGRASLPAALTRLAAAALLLLGEYAIVAIRFDGGDLWRQGGWLSGFSNAGELFTLLTLTLTAGVLLHWRRLRAALDDLPSLEPPSMAWGALHLSAFAVSLTAAFLLFEGVASGSAQVALLVLALAAGLISPLALLRGLFGTAATTLAKVVGRAMAAGALLAVLAWQAGLYARPLWPRFTQGTLGFAAWLLQRFATDVRVDGASARLGLGDFDVEIADGCSGIEGMVLVGIFLSGYLYRFRSELLLGRALVLLPCSIALAWVANAFRIAALVAIGGLGLPNVAFGGFHSKAGWVLFCAIALSTVVLLNRSPWFARAAQAPPRHDETTRDIEVDNPTAGYCLPFLALLATALVTGLFSATLDYLYGLRLVSAALALYWARGYLRELRPTFSILALAIGVAVGAFWLLFAPHDAATSDALRQELNLLSLGLRAGWLGLRLLGTALFVPIVEELAFRGFLQRRLLARDFDEVPYQHASVWSIVGSALAFGGLHASWVLGALAGVAYSLAARRRGNLVDAMVAHATSNVLVMAWALLVGRLDLLA